MIGIIDYGLGNLASVAGAVRKVGFEPVITADAGQLREADKLVLPGVGAFGDGMANIRSRGLIEPLTEMVLKRRKPILGICLGFQLLGRHSTEFGDHEGLGWINADIRPFEAAKDLRVPHVGWNEIYQKGDSVLFDGVPDESLVYYVHKYRMVGELNGALIGVGDYGGAFIAAVQQGNIFGTQFHPEKSQRHGLAMLKNFLEKA